MVPQKYVGSTPEAARYIISEGQQPVPVQRGHKDPNRLEDKGWQDKTWAADDFRPGMNIGVHHANVAAVDRDCDEARALVGKFLPQTRMSGRRSEPRSPVGTAQPCLVPRGGRRPLLAAQRHHRQDDSRAALRARQADASAAQPQPRPQRRALRHIQRGHARRHRISRGAGARRQAYGRVCLIAQCYPESGGRHDFGLHLAGFLLRNGEDEETVYDLMLAARELIGPLGRKTETTIRKAVSPTARKLEEGAEVTGGPRLKEEYDQRLPSKLATAVGWQKTDWSEGGSSRDDDRRNQADRLVQYALDAGVPLFVDQSRTRRSSSGASRTSSRCRTPGGVGVSRLWTPSSTSRAIATSACLGRTR